MNVTKNIMPENIVSEKQSFLTLRGAIGDDLQCSPKVPLDALASPGHRVTPLPGTQHHWGSFVGFDPWLGDLPCSG
jgi:hypothetical protein